MSMKINRKILTTLTLVICVVMGMTSCEDRESYSELLFKEEKAVNWFLAGKRVETEIPKDSVFEVGEDAPFYRLDEEGSVYMQVINSGNPDDRVSDGQRVYFRYLRSNIRDMYDGLGETWEGNSDNMNYTPTNFIYGNTVLPSSTQWGEGIQWPLRFFGFDSEVNLVLKSTEGFNLNNESTYCQPFIINVRYFKAEY